MVEYRFGQGSYIESELRDVHRRRDAAIKKTPGADESKFELELTSLSKNYEQLHPMLDRNRAELEEIISTNFSTIKDDIRKCYVHFISMLKNVEYDVNAELVVALSSSRNTTKTR